MKFAEEEFPLYGWRRRALGFLNAFSVRHVDNLYRRGLLKSGPPFDSSKRSNVSLCANFCFCAFLTVLATRDHSCLHPHLEPFRLSHNGRGRHVRLAPGCANSFASCSP